MKAKHRKTLWLHTIFSVVMCVGLLMIIIIKKDIAISILIAFLSLYVAGNVLIHVRRDDFRKETFLEYSLISVAIFVVLNNSLGR